MRTPNRAAVSAAGALAVALLTALRVVATVPANFTDAAVTNVPSPTGMAFTPDGRLLITTKGDGGTPGTIRVFAGGSLLVTPALSLASFNPGQILCTESERGVLGIAVDPLYATNNFVYVYYTFKRPGGNCATVGGSPWNVTTGPVNRVSRFVLKPADAPSGANTIDPLTETVLIDNVPSAGGNHNGGDLHFGKDGFLYVSIGDGGSDYLGGGSGGSNDASRDRNVLLGKLLRVDRDGVAPASNPFFADVNAVSCKAGNGTPGKICREAYAWGLRNPFRFNMDPNAGGTRLFINDVGQGTWEEIDIGLSGADYGWNVREGHCNNGQTAAGQCSPTNPPAAGITDPLFDYQHDTTVPGTSVTGCDSITGGAFVPNGVWPAAFDNTYLFADYVCGAIFRIPAAAPPPLPTTAFPFATNLGGSSATALLFGPHLNTQALYYTTFAGGGQVRRVSFNVPGNNPPTADASNSAPTSGLATLNVIFSAQGSSDPDGGDTLTYFWDFGDGSPATSTASLTIGHAYTINGTYVATLRARDQNLAFSSPVTVTITVGNRPPVAAITSPALGTKFVVGQTFTAMGTGTDPDEGALGGAALHWTILRHHATHTHPWQAGTGLAFAFPPPEPEDLASATNSFIEVHLTAIDSLNLSSLEVQQDYQPNKVNVTLQTVPAGLRVEAAGSPVTGPTVVTSWEGWNLPLNAPDQAAADGKYYRFSSWSDAGARSHLFATTASPATLTATFTLSGSKFFPITPCRVVDTRTSGGPLAAGARRVIQVTGVCSIPATAYAVSANLTVAAPTATGGVALLPGNLVPGPGTSTLSFSAGKTRASNALSFLSSDGLGTVAVRNDSTGTVQVILDVNGYFQ